MRLVELGRLTRLTWKGGAEEWSLAKAPLLGVTPDGRRLAIVYVKPGTKLAQATPSERAHYTKLHWGKLGLGDVRAGEVAGGPWTELGPGIAITYTTRKLGDGEPVDYEHVWGDIGGGKTKPRWTPPRIKRHDCGERGCPDRGRLAIVGGSYRVTSHGIVG